MSDFGEGAFARVPDRDSIVDMLANAINGLQLHVAQQDDGSVLITDGYRMFRSVTWANAEKRNEAVRKCWKKWTTDPSLKTITPQPWVWDAIGERYRLFLTASNEKIWIREAFLEAFATEYPDLKDYVWETVGQGREIVVRWADSTAVLMPATPQVPGAVPSEPTEKDLSDE